MDGLNRAVAHFGSQRALADALGIRQPSIVEWYQRGSVPLDRCEAIELLTDGAVRADDLRSDVQWVRDVAGKITGYFVPRAA